MRIPDMSRCEASLSASYYDKKTKADGTYDHDVWLQYDGNHVRCQDKGKTLRRNEWGWYDLCGMHDLMARRTKLFYPYIPPGRECKQPCCVSTWQVSTWTPSSRVRA